GGSLELQRLEASVVSVGEHKATGERGVHTDFRRGERALRSIADEEPTLAKSKPARVGHPRLSQRFKGAPPALYKPNPKGAAPTFCHHAKGAPPADGTGNTSYTWDYE